MLPIAMTPTWTVCLSKSFNEICPRSLIKRQRKMTEGHMHMPRVSVAVSTTWQRCTQPYSDGL